MNAGEIAILPVVRESHRDGDVWWNYAIVELRDVTVVKMQYCGAWEPAKVEVDAFIFDDPEGAYDLGFCLMLASLVAVLLNQDPNAQSVDLLRVSDAIFHRQLNEG